MQLCIVGIWYKVQDRWEEVRPLLWEINIGNFAYNEAVSRIVSPFLLDEGYGRMLTLRRSLSCGQQHY